MVKKSKISGHGVKASATLNIYNLKYNLPFQEDSPVLWRTLGEPSLSALAMRSQIPTLEYADSIET